MVMETPSAQCVGREFVRQYYTLLHEAPLHLHRFYSHNSCFVHGGVEKPGEEQPPVTGQSDIHKKICSLNFRDCHAKIRQVDSQATVGHAVVVQVTGELSNNGQPMRRFMQTFVLVPQSPKKYYVHNDIFRYQDEVFHDNDTDTENIEEIVDSEPETHDSVGDNIENQPYYDTRQPLSNGSAHVEEPMEPVESVAVKEETEIEREKTPEPDPPQEDTEVNKDDIYETKPTEDKVVEPEPEPQGPPRPVTWAAMISSNKGVSNNAQPAPTPVVSTKTQAVSPPKQVDIKQDSAPGPQPQRAARPIRDRGAPRERDGSRSGIGESDDSRRSRYPDSHQVFVGNLPHNVSENDLKAFFNDFGKVVELRINKKGNVNVPNFGFVVFDDDKAVQSVLSQKGTLTLSGGHRLNVEEKKQRGEGGRPGSGTRQGRGGMGRGGLGGPTRGGRGGPMGPGGLNRADSRGRGTFGGGGGPRR